MASGVDHIIRRVIDLSVTHAPQVSQALSECVCKALLLIVTDPLWVEAASYFIHKTAIRLLLRKQDVVECNRPDLPKIFGELGSTLNVRPQFRTIVDVEFHVFIAPAPPLHALD